MKKRAFGLIFGFAVAVLSLVVCLPKNAVYAAIIENTKTAYYLLDDDNTPYKSSIEAGSSTGYNEYILTETNVEPIEATANKGFKFVGWRVMFTGDVSDQYETTRTIDGSTILNNSAIYQTADFSITYSAAEMEGSFDVNYTITMEDRDGDGYNDYGKLEFDQVVENATIDPVFDYIYNNIDATSLIELDDINNTEKWQKITNVLTDTNLIYTNSVNENGTTKYANSYLEKSGKYYYFGDVYCDDGTTSYYTLNTKITESSADSETLKVLIENGRYRTNDIVTIQADVNLDETDLNIGKSIDVYSVGFAYDDSENLLGEDEWNVVKDTYSRTKQINISSTMPESSTYEVVLSVKYDDLYIATIVPKINDEDASENEDYVLKALTININSYFSKIDSKNYFVKDATTAQNTSGFNLTANEKITNNGYEYYKFEKLYSSYLPVSESISKNKLFLTNKIEQNFEIEINYVPVLYNVEFRFALYDETTKKFRKIDGSFNVEQTISLERGKTTDTIVKTDVSNNVGYTFVGFVAEENTVSSALKTGVSPQSETIVSINQTKPTNKTILMLFVETDYIIRFNNFNQISLNDGTKDIYPIAGASLSILRNGNSSVCYLQNVDGLNLTSTFDKSAKLGDSISLAAIANNGFVFAGFKFSTAEDAEITAGNLLTFELTQEFLAAYDQAGTIYIDIYDIEQYQTYTVTYTLNGAKNGEDVTVIMADLSVKIGDIVYTTSNTDAGVEYIVDEENTKIQFVVSNLNLYQKIELQAKAKSINNDGNEPYYMFNRFTENFQTNFTLISTEDANTKATSYFVKKDIEIFVVYSMPILKLNISIDNNLAYDLQQTISENSTYITDNDGVTSYFDASTLQISSLTLNKSYVLHIAETLNFGYKLVGYKYNDTIYSVSSLDNIYQFPFVTAATAEMRTIEILTEAIEYKLNLTYAFNEEDAATSIDSYNITIENLLIEFNMLDGYYAGKAYFVTSTTKHSFEQAAQTNDYNSNIYSYELAKSDFEDIVNLYSEYAPLEDINILNLHFIYVLHTYTVKVEYNLVNSKDFYDSMVNFPSISMTADGSKVNYYDNANGREFVNIAYGAKLVLTVENDSQDGMELCGWIYDKQADDVVSLTQLTIAKIVSNHNIIYQLNYSTYSILTIEQGNTRKAIVKIEDAVTGNEISTISRFDKLTIDTNADKQNGWNFVNLYYYKYEYQPYTYDATTFNSFELYVSTERGYKLNTESYVDGVQYYEKVKVKQNYSAFVKYSYSQENWATNWLNVFYLSDDKYVRNTSSAYNENTTYFVYSNTIYVDADFQVGNYYPELNDNGTYQICFTLEYEYVDIAVTFSASTQGNANLHKGDLTIDAIDYANLSLSIKNTAGKLKNIDLNSVIHYNDNILKVKISLKTINKDGANVDLCKGVELISAYVCDATKGNLTITKDDSLAGVYWLEIDITTMLSNNCLSTNNSFDIYLTYQVKSKRMILTTNVPENSSVSGFYKDSFGSTIFSMSNSQNNYGFGNSSRSSSGSDKLTDNFQFMGKVYISYAFVGNYSGYSQYFSIQGIKLYTIVTTVNSYGLLTYTKGQLISVSSEEDYAKYGLTNISYSSNCFDYRYINDLYIELQVQPIIVINDDDNCFEFTYNCDLQGNGVENQITIGQDQNCNIQIANILANSVKMSFHKNIIQNNLITGYEEQNSKLIDSGKYLIKFEFVNSASFNWLSVLNFDKDVYAVIIPRELEIRINQDLFAAKTAYEQTYKGKNNFKFDGDIYDLLNYVYLTDGINSYAYSNDNENFRLNGSAMSAVTTYTSGTTQVKSGMATKDGELFNILLTGLKLNNSLNFNLKNSELLFENAIKINKKQIILSGVQAYDKVYDGTDQAEIVTDSALVWTGVISGDIVDTANHSDLVLTFEKDSFGNCPIGYNINVLIDASNVLKGLDADNYSLKVIGTTANIYPYKLSTHIDGVGTIEIRNDKGLINNETGTRHDLVDLIPIDAKLKVGTIYSYDIEYSSLYSKMSNFLNRNRAFVIGYRIYLDNNNITSKLNNNLTLVLPDVDRLTNVLMLTGSDTVELNYTKDNGSLIIDLSQTNFEPNTFAIIQQRVLLKRWQLILIISLALLVLIVIIIIFVISRKRKKAMYKVNDKI